MRKLQSTTKDVTETFDETLRKLFEKKMRCEMAINQVSLVTTAHINVQHDSENGCQVSLHFVLKCPL